jgi:hypothetical protein
MFIMGCDPHARFQQIAMLDPQTGERIERRLEHENGEARAFYAAFRGRLWALAVAIPASRGWIEEDCTAHEEWSAERGMASQWTVIQLESGRSTFRTQRQAALSLLVCAPGRDSGRLRLCGRGVGRSESRLIVDPFVHHCEIGRPLADGA